MYVDKLSLIEIYNLTERKAKEEYLNLIIMNMKLLINTADVSNIEPLQAAVKKSWNDYLDLCEFYCVWRKDVVKELNKQLKDNNEK